MSFPYLEGRRSRHHCSISFVSFSGENVHFFYKKTPLPISFPPYGLALATFGCESWTVRKNKGFDAFEMKGLRKILRVSWTAKKTNEYPLKENWSKEGTVRHRQA